MLKAAFDHARLVGEVLQEVEGAEGWKREVWFQPEEVNQGRQQHNQEHKQQDGMKNKSYQE